MEKTDIIIIGAGVVGLAIAERLSQHKKEIVVLEQHDGFGRETSSRNSEVIHAGFYYPANSLKTKLCVRGNPMLYDYCRQNNIPYKRIGKLVVGNSSTEIAKLKSLYKQGKRNGVPELRMVKAKEIGQLEPLVTAQAGLLSHSTGIIDSHALMKSFAAKACSQNAIIAHNSCVIGIEHSSGVYHVHFFEGETKRETLVAPILINSAGLQSDVIAQMAGIDIDAHNLKLHLCKGEYFSVSSVHKGKLNRLVYPAPTKISLGTHAVLRLDGSLQLGPNAFYVHTIDYDVDPAHRVEFYKSSHPFFPFISESDLTPYQSGIRPKLQSENDEFRDFYIAEESDKGLPGLVNLIGIESPGLTASLAIAEMVEGILLKKTSFN